MRPRWAWLLWVQLAIVLLATLAAYLGLLNLAVLTVPGMDKLLHFLLSGALAFFSVGWWADRRPWTVLGILSALAILEEVAQSLSAVRSCSTVDLTATLLGILAFGLAGRRLVHKRKRASRGRRSA
jgi:VanZ family protein